jgi:hypothetical protein
MKEENGCSKEKEIKGQKRHGTFSPLREAAEDRGLPAMS